MRTLMDDVEVERLDPGTKVILRRRVVPLGAPAMAGAERPEIRCDAMGQIPNEPLRIDGPRRRTHDRARRRAGHGGHRDADEGRQVLAADPGDLILDVRA